MLNKNKKNKGYSPRMYKPGIVSQKDIDENMKKAFKGQSQGKGFGFGKPISLNKQENYPQPRFGRPMQTSLDDFSTKKPEPEPEDEPYWSAEQWEEWALKIYEQYPEIREVLPSWFIEAVEQ